MLIKINIENFKSFDAPTELTMISSNKIRINHEHKVKIKSTQVLKYSAIYGANASGKSNLVFFFKFFKDCLQNGIPMEAVRFYCRNKPENKEKESKFEIQFTVKDKFYAYGFSAILSKRKITSEWLYELYQNGSARCLFERTEHQLPILDDSISLNAEDKNRFHVYANDFLGNETSLFLSEMNKGKKFNSHSKLSFFKETYEWLNDAIIVITPDMPLFDLEYYYDEESLSLINRLIETFDTGISKVKIEEISLDELSTMLPKPVFENVLNQIKSKMEETSNPSFRMTMRSNKSFFNIEVNGHENLKVTTIRLKHRQSLFDFEEESDGTQRLFNLMDMLLNKKEDILYVVDELERSLHPKLTEHFLQLFMEYHEQDRMQLMFTTHESAIMDQSLFRRDEIWFIERNHENNSQIYSLDRFKERYDKVLSKAYLDGRYGAIPVFSEFDFIEDDSYGSC